MVHHFLKWAKKRELKVLITGIVISVGITTFLQGALKYMIDPILSPLLHIVDIENDGNKIGPFNFKLKDFIKNIIFLILTIVAAYNISHIKL